MSSYTLKGIRTELDNFCEPFSLRSEPVLTNFQSRWVDVFESLFRQYLDEVRVIVGGLEKIYSIFLSYPHPTEENKQLYYNQFALFFHETLDSLGFNVLFDQSHDSNVSISNLGTKAFMDHLTKVDFVCSLMSPLYYEKIQNQGSGVSYEVTKILERIHINPDQPNYGFFLPLLLHDSNPQYDISLLGFDEVMKDSLYYDFRDRKKFYLNFSKFLSDGLLKRIVSKDHSICHALLVAHNEFQKMVAERLEDEIIFEGFERQLTAVSSLLNPLNHEISLSGNTNSPKGILLVGPTGAGKSVLASFLTGKSLDVIENGDGDLILIDDALTASIHAFGSSKVANPHLAERNGQYFIIWDIPGCRDVGGSDSDLVKLSTLLLALRNQMSVQVVFVIDEPRLKTARSREIIDCLNQLTSMFDLNELKSMISFVVARHTRVKGVRKLSEYSEDQDSELSSKGRDLINFLVHEQERRCWNFPCPIAGSQGSKYQTSNQSLWEKLSVEDNFVSKPRFCSRVSLIGNAHLRMIYKRLKTLCQQLVQNSFEVGEQVEQFVSNYEQDPANFKSYFATMIYDPIRRLFGSHETAEELLEALPLVSNFLSLSHYDALLMAFNKLKVLQHLQDGDTNREVENDGYGEEDESYTLFLANDGVEQYLEELKLLFHRPEEYIPYFDDRTIETGILEKVFVSSFLSFKSFLSGNTTHDIEKRISINYSVRRSYFPNDSKLITAITYTTIDDPRVLHCCEVNYSCESKWDWVDYSYLPDEETVAINLEFSFSGFDGGIRPKCQRVFKELRCDVGTSLKKYLHDDGNLRSKVFVELVYEVPADVSDLMKRFQVINPLKDYLLTTIDYRKLEHQVLHENVVIRYRRVDRSHYILSYPVHFPEGSSREELPNNLQLQYIAALSVANTTRSEVIEFKHRVHSNHHNHHQRNNHQHNKLMVKAETSIQHLKTIHNQEVQKLRKKDFVVVDKTLDISQEFKQTIISTNDSEKTSTGGFTRTTKYQRVESTLAKLQSVDSQHYHKNRLNRKKSSKTGYNGPSEVKDSKTINGEIIEKIGFDGVYENFSIEGGFKHLQMDYSGKRNENGVTVATENSVGILQVEGSTSGYSKDNASVSLYNGTIQNVQGVRDNIHIAIEFKPGQEKYIVTTKTTNYEHNASSTNGIDTVANPQLLAASDKEILNHVNQNIDGFKSNHQEIVTGESSSTVANVTDDRYLGLVKENYIEKDGVIDESSRVSRPSNVAMKGYSATCGSIMNVLIPKICRGEVITMKDIASTIGNSVEALAQGQLAEVMDMITKGKSQSIETNTMSLFGLAYIAIIVIRHTSNHFKYGRVVKVEYDDIDDDKPLRYEVQDISDKKVFVFDTSSPPSFTTDLFIGREIEFHPDSPTSTVKKGVIKRILTTGYELDINKTVPQTQVKCIHYKSSDYPLAVDDYVSFYTTEGMGKTIIDGALEALGTVVQTGIAIYQHGFQQTALVAVAQFAISSVLILSDWYFSKITTEQMSSNLWAMAKDLITSNISGNIGMLCFYTPVMMIFPALSAFITIPIGIAAYSLGNFLYQKISGYFHTKQLENEYKELCRALGLEVNCTDTIIATRMRQRYLKCATDQTNCIHQGKILEVDNTTNPLNIKYKIEFRHGLDVWNDIPHEMILNEGRMNSNGDLITCFKVDDIVKVRFKRSKQIFQKTTEDFHRLKELRIILKKSSLFYDGQITVFYALSNWITHRYYASYVATSNPDTSVEEVEGHLEESDNEILIALEHNIIPNQMNPY